MKSRCSVFVSFVQNENKENYTVSFILIFELSILKQNQKSPRFSQLLPQLRTIHVYDPPFWLFLQFYPGNITEPGDRFSKAPETFRARKSIAKSRTLRLQACFILIF